LLGDETALQGAPTRHVAIVGTRQASRYGERIADRLAAACSRAGLVVVSGLARGVDSVAHRAALAAGGATVAVQGTGVDVPYPVGHRALHGELARRATVVSEMEPGTPATAGCFPRRNRIIAGLCEVTVVVEAGFKSGAVNTASQALDLGRTVAAVPGPIDEPRSAGCNLLIRDGAQVVTCVEDLLNLFELSTIGREPVADIGRSKVGVLGASSASDALAESVLGILEAGGMDSTEIAGRLAVPIRQLSTSLLELELVGAVQRDGERFALGKVGAGGTDRRVLR
jgi:DNA processing protein